MTDLKKLAEEYGLSADQSLLKIEVARRAYLAGARAGIEAAAALASSRAYEFERCEGWADGYGRGFNVAVENISTDLRSLLPEVST